MTDNLDFGMFSGPVTSVEDEDFGMFSGPVSSDEDKDFGMFSDPLPSVETAVTPQLEAPVEVVKPENDSPNSAVTDFILRDEDSFAGKLIEARQREHLH